MNLIEVSFDRTCDKSTALAKYAKKRLAQSIYPQHGLTMHVRCYIEHDQQIIKAQVKLPSRPKVVIETKSRDMYKTVGLMVPKVRRYIKHALSMMHRDKKYFDHRKAA